MSGRDIESLPPIVPVKSEVSVVEVNKATLNEESTNLINKIIAETDTTKTKDLIELFNTNQTKKTMVRVNKLGDLLDTITDQTITRYASKPDEISNQELLQGLKIVQDIVERGQKQIADNTNNKPLIQVNQQNNEINLGEAGSNLTKESRDKVKSAVMSILANIQSQAPAVTQEEPDIIEAKISEISEEENDDK